MQKLKQGEWGYTVFPWPGDVDIQILESMSFKLKRFLVIKEMAVSQGFSVIAEGEDQSETLDPAKLFSSKEEAVSKGVEIFERSLFKLQGARAKLQKLMDGA